MLHMSHKLSYKVMTHLSVFLSLLALWGGLDTGNTYLYLLAALAGYGALCFAFSHTNDTIHQLWGKK